VDLLRRDLEIAGEGELFEVLHPRHMRFANGPVPQPDFTFLEFGLKQRFEEAQVRAAFAYSLLGELAALRSDPSSGRSKWARAPVSMSALRACVRPAAS
jgi:hypothetical protein